MIINQLDYLERNLDDKAVKGGISFTDFSANTLVLGFNNSQQGGGFEALNVSSPGSNIAGFKFAYRAQAD